MKSTNIRRKVAGLLIGVSMLAPATTSIAVAAPTPDTSQSQSGSDAAREAAQRIVNTSEESGGGTYDMSTNCSGTDAPFITGVVRDANNNPVAGARVNVTILGLTFPNPANLGPFRMWETKADGSYSICAWGEGGTLRSYLQEQGDLNGRHALIATATPPENSSGATLGSQITLMVYVSPSQYTQDAAGVSSACLDPARNSTLKCVRDFKLGAPIVTAKVKGSDGNAIPRAMTSLEYFYRPNLSPPGTAYDTEEKRNAAGVWTQLGLMPTNSTGDFGMSGFTSTNKFRLKVQAPECYPGDGATCPYGDLGSQSDSFTVTVANPADPLNTSTVAWETNSQTNRDFVLVPANLRGQVADGVGANLYSLVQMNISDGTTSLTDTTQYGGSFALTLANGTWSVEIVAPSWAIGTNATYSVTVSGGAVTNISRTTAPVGTVCADATACLNNLKLSLTPPNFLFLVKDTDGNIVEGADIMLEEYATPAMQGGWPWTYKSSQQSGTAEYGQTAGLGGFSLTNDKIYRVQVRPPWNGSSDLVRTDYYLKVSADGSEVRRCATFNNSPTSTPCEFGWTGSLSDSANLLSKDGNGWYTLTMAVANFRGFVCAPGAGSDCTVVPYTNVDVQRWQASQCQGCTGWYQWIGMNSWAGQSGSIALSIETEGRYKLQVNPPMNPPGAGASDATLYAKNDIEFYADQVGNDWKFYTLDANGDATSTELSTVTVGTSTRIGLRLKTPSFVGVVQSAGGTKSTYSWVELKKETPSENCATCAQWLGGASTNSDGVFALSLEAGKHVLTANPSWTLESEGLTRTEFKISALDCDSDGSVEIYTYSSSSCTSPTPVTAVDGKITITLLGANFAGVVKRPDGDESAVSSVQVDVEKWFTCSESYFCGNAGGYWTWAGKNDWTDNSGKFGLNVTEAGTYRATFRPPSNLQSQYSASRIEFTVAGDPAVVTATPDASVFSYNAGTGEYTVKLKLPNASGTVTLPFDGTDNDPAAYTWINVEKWSTEYCFDGCYQWTPDASGANTNASGDYGLTLPAGRWKLTYNPPWGQTGVAKGTREVVVTSSGTLCTLAASGGDGTTCPGATIAPGALDVELPSPNFSGIVKNPDTSASQWSSIQFQRWDSTYAWWQWTNVWANTDNNGKFGVNMTENGSYRVTFEPSWQVAGVSAKTIYIRVCDAGAVVELMANETAAKTGTTCSGSGTLGDPTTVYTLIGANVQGIVIDGSNSATLGDAWVAILNCDDGQMNDWCSWERGVNTKGFGTDKGKFAVNLTHTSGGSVTKYRIEINPPWNTTAGLVRAQYDVWVKDFDAGSTGDEWCLDADYNSGAGTCSTPRNSDSTAWSVTLTAGNLAGKMLAPTGSDPVAYGWMQVEKWTQQPWNTSAYYWQWTNYWVNSNQSGSFGLNIPGATDAGLFRLSANPGWDNPNGYARKRMYIRVAANDQWCEQAINDDLISDPTPYGSDGTGAECTAGTDNVADSVTGLTVRLSASNLSGTLYTSTTDLTSDSALGTAANKVRDAWMSLQIKRSYDWNNTPLDATDDWVYWEWLGGTNTSGSTGSRGKFGFNVEEDGEYRIDVQPSWRDMSGLDGQFYLNFSATSCGDGDGCAIALTGSPDNALLLAGGTYAIKYPPPNFKGTVKDKDGTNAIAGSWISIFKNNWEWVTGLSTGWNGANAGRFGTKLDDGTYRVEVWPRWDDATSGMRRVITLVVAAGAVTTCTPGCDLTNPGDPTDTSRTLTLRGENLSGRVYYPGATDATDTYAQNTLGNQTRMPWAWAEVRTCGDVAGNQCDWGQTGVTWVDSQGTNETGLLRLGLDPATNPYLVTVWPNWGYYSASPLRLLVLVDNDGVATWTYESEKSGGYLGTGTAFNPDFGRIPPNVEVTVTGVDEQRFVKLYECVGGTDDAGTPLEYECTNGTWDEVIVIGSVEASANTWKSSFTVTAAGGYKVIVLRTEEDVTAGGTLSGATASFEYDGTNPVTKTIAVRP